MGIPFIITGNHHHHHAVAKASGLRAARAGRRPRSRLRRAGGHPSSPAPQALSAVTPTCLLLVALVPEARQVQALLWRHRVGSPFRTRRPTALPTVPTSLSPTPTPLPSSRRRACLADAPPDAPALAAADAATVPTAVPAAVADALPSPRRNRHSHRRFPRSTYSTADATAHPPAVAVADPPQLRALLARVVRRRPYQMKEEPNGTASNCPVAAVAEVKVVEVEVAVRRR